MQDGTTTLENRSAACYNKLCLHVTTWMNLAAIMVSERSHSQKVPTV